MAIAIQTHGALLHWHPHIHALVTCGGFTPKGQGGKGVRNEWHCRLRRKDLRRAAAAALARSVGVARGRIDPIETGAANLFAMLTGIALGARPSLAYHPVCFETFLESSG